MEQTIFLCFQVINEYTAYPIDKNKDPLLETIIISYLNKSIGYQQKDIIISLLQEFDKLIYHKIHEDVRDIEIDFNLSRKSAKFCRNIYSRLKNTSVKIYKKIEKKKLFPPLKIHNE